MNRRSHFKGTDNYLFISNHLTTKHSVHFWELYSFAKSCDVKISILLVICFFPDKYLLILLASCSAGPMGWVGATNGGMCAPLYRHVCGSFHQVGARFVTVSIVMSVNVPFFSSWLWLLINIVVNSFWRWRDWFHSNLKSNCECALIIKDNRWYIYGFNNWHRHKSCPDLVEWPMYIYHPLLGDPHFWPLLHPTLACSMAPGDQVASL